MEIQHQRCKQRQAQHVRSVPVGMLLNPNPKHHHIHECTHAHTHAHTHANMCALHAHCTQTYAQRVARTYLDTDIRQTHFLSPFPRWTVVSLNCIVPYTQQSQRRTKHFCKCTLLFCAHQTGMNLSALVANVRAVHRYAARLMHQARRFCKHAHQVAFIGTNMSWHETAFPELLQSFIASDRQKLR